MVAQAARGMCLAAALLSALAGCSPIEAYRSARGLDKSDPDPATAPFSKNLAAGEVADYPNLSTVPPPPTTASTTAERAALTQKLVAERTTAEADIGTPPVATAAPPAPGAPTKVAAGVPSAVIAPAPAPAAPAPAAPATVASAAAPPETAVPDTTAQPAASARQHGRQPKEAPPQESSLQMPVIPTVPEGEATQPPPPAPHLAPAPFVGPVQSPATTAAVAVPVPAPAPPVPVMAAPAPPPPVIPAATEIRRSQATSVAAFDLADPPRLAADQRARLGQVAETYRNKPGTVKIVAYAAPAPAGAQQLASFRAALDRAQFVAAALAEAGIPSNKIQTEAAPAGAGGSVGRVEVRLAP